MPGSNLTYRVSVTNAGPGLASNVVYRDALPAGVVPVGSAVTNLVIGDVEAGWSTSFFYTVTVGRRTIGWITNTAWVTSSTPDTVRGDESHYARTLITGRLCDVVLTGVDTPDPVAAGGELFYRFTVSNQGPVYADEVWVTNWLSSEVTFSSNAPGAAWTLTNGIIRCFLGDLAPGQVTNLGIYVNVSTGAVGVITNEAGCGTLTAEVTLTNNHARIATRVWSEGRGFIPVVTEWSFSRQHGWFIGSALVSNPVDSAYMYSEPFYLAVPTSPDVWLVYPEGEVLGAPYVNMTADMLLALATNGNRDAVLDPGERVRVSDIDLVHRFKHDPTDYVNSNAFLYATMCLVQEALGGEGAVGMADGLRFLGMRVGPKGLVLTFTAPDGVRFRVESVPVDVKSLENAHVVGEYRGKGGVQSATGRVDDAGCRFYRLRAIKE